MAISARDSLQANCDRLTLRLKQVEEAAVRDAQESAELLAVSRQREETALADASAKAALIDSMERQKATASLLTAGLFENEVSARQEAVRNLELANQRIAVLTGQLSALTQKAELSDGLQGELSDARERLRIANAQNVELTLQAGTSAELAHTVGDLQDQLQTLDSQLQNATSELVVALTAAEDRNRLYSELEERNRQLNDASTEKDLALAELKDASAKLAQLPGLEQRAETAERDLRILRLEDREVGETTLAELRKARDTAVEALRNFEEDDLVFFVLLYWALETNPTPETSLSRKDILKATIQVYEGRTQKSPDKIRGLMQKKGPIPLALWNAYIRRRTQQKPAKV